jgi:hypothetical protein
MRNMIDIRDIQIIILTLQAGVAKVALPESIEPKVAGAHIISQNIISIDCKEKLL